MEGKGLERRETLFLQETENDAIEREGRYVQGEEWHIAWDRW